MFVEQVMWIYRFDISTFVNLDDSNVLYSIGAELVVIIIRDQLMMLSGQVNDASDSILPLFIQSIQHILIALALSFLILFIHITQEHYVATACIFC